VSFNLNQWFTVEYSDTLLVKAPALENRDSFALCFMICTCR